VPKSSLPSSSLPSSSSSSKMSTEDEYKFGVVSVSSTYDCKYLLTCCGFTDWNGMLRRQMSGVKTNERAQESGVEQDQDQDQGQGHGQDHGHNGEDKTEHIPTGQTLQRFYQCRDMNSINIWKCPQTLHVKNFHQSEFELLFVLSWQAANRIIRKTYPSSVHGTLEMIFLNEWLLTREDIVRNAQFQKPDRRRRHHRSQTALLQQQQQQQQQEELVVSYNECYCFLNVWRASIDFEEKGDHIIKLIQRHRFITPSTNTLFLNLVHNCYTYPYVLLNAVSFDPNPSNVQLAYSNYFAAHQSNVNEKDKSDPGLKQIMIQQPEEGGGRDKVMWHRLYLLNMGWREKPRSSRLPTGMAKQLRKSIQPWLEQIFWIDLDAPAVSVTACQSQLTLCAKDTPMSARHMNQWKAWIQKTKLSQRSAKIIDEEKANTNINTNTNSNINTNSNAISSSIGPMSGSEMEWMERFHHNRSFGLCVLTTLDVRYFEIFKAKSSMLSLFATKSAPNAIHETTICTGVPSCECNPLTFWRNSQPNTSHCVDEVKLQEQNTAASTSAIPSVDPTPTQDSELELALELELESESESGSKKEIRKSSGGVLQPMETVDENAVSDTRTIATAKATVLNIINANAIESIDNANNALDMDTSKSVAAYSDTDGLSVIATKGMSATPSMTGMEGSLSTRALTSITNIGGGESLSLKEERSKGERGTVGISASEEEDSVVLKHDEELHVSEDTEQDVLMTTVITVPMANSDKTANETKSVNDEDKSSLKHSDKVPEPSTTSGHAIVSNDLNENVSPQVTETRGDTNKDTSTITAILVDHDLTQSKRISQGTNNKARDSSSEVDDIDVQAVTFSDIAKIPVPTHEDEEDSLPELPPDSTNRRSMLSFNKIASATTTGTNENVTRSHPLTLRPSSSRRAMSSGVNITTQTIGSSGAGSSMHNKEMKFYQRLNDTIQQHNEKFMGKLDEKFHDHQIHCNSNTQLGHFESTLQSCFDKLMDKQSDITNTLQAMQKKIDTLESTVTSIQRSNTSSIADATTAKTTKPNNVDQNFFNNTQWVDLQTTIQNTTRQTNQVLEILQRESQERQGLKEEMNGVIQAQFEQKIFPLLGKYISHVSQNLSQKVIVPTCLNAIHTTSSVIVRDIMEEVKKKLGELNKVDSARDNDMKTSQTLQSTLSELQTHVTTDVTQQLSVYFDRKLPELLKKHLSDSSVPNAASDKNNGKLAVRSFSKIGDIKKDVSATKVLLFFFKKKKQKQKHIYMYIQFFFFVGNGPFTDRRFEKTFAGHSITLKCAGVDESTGPNDPRTYDPSATATGDDSNHMSSNLDFLFSDGLLRNTAFDAPNPSRFQSRDDYPSASPYFPSFKPHESFLPRSQNTLRSMAPTNFSGNEELQRAIDSINQLQEQVRIQQDMIGGLQRKQERGPLRQSHYGHYNPHFSAMHPNVNPSQWTPSQFQPNVSDLPQSKFCIIFLLLLLF
ncbi:chitinase (predicted), partial [Reticulomyxa filosa]